MPQIAPTGTILARDATVDGKTISAPQPPAVLSRSPDAGPSALQQGTMVPRESRNGATVEADATIPYEGDVNGVESANGEAHNGAAFVRPEIPQCFPERSPSLFAKQEWAGRVTAIREDEFDARLRDITEGGREVATIEMEEVGPEDRARMYVGARFHLVMGYERSLSGTRSNVSRLVFLNPTRLTKRDMERGRQWADWLHERWGLE